jgi:hypothetical protein
MNFLIQLEPDVFNDVQEAILYYDKQQIGLGIRFFQSVSSAIETLSLNPFYQIKYDNVRCFLVKPFPYIIHFIVDENDRKVIILAIIHTSANPANWPRKEG